MDIVIKTFMELLPAIILLIAFLLAEHFFKLKERAIRKFKKKYYIFSILFLVLLLIIFSVVDKSNSKHLNYLFIVIAACLSATPEKREK